VRRQFERHVDWQIRAFACSLKKPLRGGAMHDAVSCCIETKHGDQVQQLRRNWRRCLR
tara:strand:+ start:703 stop:876 length:174 start_codon:yes stop_codon:yes gene_type:complete